MSHWDFRLAVGLCELVLAAFKTEEFVVAEASKLYDPEAMQINISVRHLSRRVGIDSCL